MHSKRVEFRRMLNVLEAVVLIRIQFSLAVRLQRPVAENRCSMTVPVTTKHKKAAQINRTFRTSHGSFQEVLNPPICLTLGESSALRTVIA